MRTFLFAILLAGALAAQTTVPVGQVSAGSVVGVLLNSASGQLVVGRLAGAVSVDWTTSPPTVTFALPSTSEMRFTSGAAGWTVAAASCARVYRNGIRQALGMDYTATVADGVVSLHFLTAANVQPSDLILGDCTPILSTSVRQ